VEDIPQALGWLRKAGIGMRAALFPGMPAGAAAPDQPALVVFTSGSEAHPKGVVLSHAAILSNIEQLGQVIDFNAQDRFLGTLPLHHTYGLTVCTLLPLLHGARICLHTSPLHYDTIPRLARDWRATCLFGTSSFLYHYARHAHADDFRSVRHVVCGGEKLSDEVRATWMEKFGLRILEGYGASECAPVISVNTPLAYKQGSVGRLLPGIEHRIEAVPGIAEGGVLHLRGPNLMLGYYLHDRPGVLQPPASVYGAGWYNTGDVV
jgi:acyl-[acyl-carrier-protein]-phospholipid O-acyltransferase/long-chain-fatty-acid--[acyl-carrier-protein] ligase